MFTLAGFIGIAVASASITLSGQVLWHPLILIDRWDNRALSVLSQHPPRAGHLRVAWRVGTLPVGNTREVCHGHVESFPRQLVHSLLCSATGFLSFISDYTVFLGPISGIMITDVRSRALFVLVFIKGLLSIGWCTARMSTFPQCIGLTGGIGIHME